jgi:hypothetical protein
MRFELCEKECAVTEAAYRGTLSAELLNHASDCPVCREVITLSEALRAEALSLDNELCPPDAGSIWQRAQQKAREEAIAKATLPIRIAVACAMVVAVASLPWAVAYMKELPLKFPGVKSASSLDTNWLAIFSGTTGLALTVSLLCVALSSWFVLREE